jgi:hypothetical protein
MAVQQKQIIYIPHVFPHGNWREFGGLQGMKKYMRKVFAGKEEDGTLTLGCVKKVDMVDNTSKTSMLVDYSAFVHIIPSNSETCKTILTKLSEGRNHRFVHNSGRGFYWDLILSDKSQLKRLSDKCVQTSIPPPSPSNVSVTTCQTDQLDEVIDSFDCLSCEHERPAKRRRMESD